MTQLRLILLSLAFAILSLSAAQAADHTFAKPKSGGMRVDWCYVWGAQCGQPAADRFCQSQSYTKSIDFVEDVDIGASGIDTVVQGTGQVCHGAFCDGFTYITCQKPDLPIIIPLPLPLPLPTPGPTPSGDSKQYNNPKKGGFRVNVCLKKNVECDGDAAADAYCDSKGWDQSSDFDESDPLPPFVKSKFLGNGKICKGSKCVAFDTITCENN